MENRVEAAGPNEKAEEEMFKKFTRAELISDAHDTTKKTDEEGEDKVEAAHPIDKSEVEVLEEVIRADLIRDAGDNEQTNEGSWRCS